MYVLGLENVKDHVGLGVLPVHEEGRVYFVGDRVAVDHELDEANNGAGREALGAVLLHGEHQGREARRVELERRRWHEFELPLLSLPRSKVLVAAVAGAQWCEGLVAPVQCLGDLRTSDSRRTLSSRLNSILQKRDE